MIAVDFLLRIGKSLRSDDRQQSGAIDRLLVARSSHIELLSSADGRR